MKLNGPSSALNCIENPPNVFGGYSLTLTKIYGLNQNQNLLRSLRCCSIFNDHATQYFVKNSNL